MFRLHPRLLALTLAAVSLTHVASAAAQPEESDDEQAGHSRGGYSWGQGGDTGDSSGGGPATHRFARIFGSLGAGATIRIILYENLAQDRVAPPYLQLRAGYFFEGEGLVQHGAVLGVGTGLNPDGTVSFGVDAFAQWTLTPAYVARFWLDGDLGNWLQVTGRFGVPLSFAPSPDGTYFGWGLEGAAGLIFEFLTGLGLYVEADVSVYFAQDYHPLISFEGGLVIDYEVLP